MRAGYAEQYCITMALSLFIYISGQKRLGQIETAV